GSATAAKMQAGTDSQLDHLQSQHLWLARHARAVSSHSNHLLLRDPRVSHCRRALTRG
ncbi:hypothetical protein BC830DRAFT_1114679, partial [Chytriomyces sp. MP71]